MMHAFPTSKMVVVVLLAFLIGAPARGAEEADALKKRRAELEAKQMDVYRQLAELRRAAEKSPEIAPLAKAAADARAAYDAKVAKSEKVQGARKLADEAAADARKIAAAEVAADPDYQAAQKELAAADERAFDLESQQRIARFVLDEMRRRAARAADLQPARDAVNAAEQAYQQAKKDNKDVEGAKAERERARKAYDDAVAAKVAAMPDAAAQQKKIDDLGAQLKDARAAEAPLNKKLAQARADVAQKSTKAQEARKAADALQAAVREAMQAAAADERAAADKAQQALQDAVKAKVDADPKAAELKKSQADLAEQLKELRAQARGAK